ncbi:hypothetical protein A0U40_17805 [[Bacillus] sp. KCTC 13219]|nr:hypothetical protein A0U40_17805 [[Bacillus] sp. KCTC 13219]
MELGERLRSLREKRGLKQTEFAERMGIPNQNVSNYERGFRQPDYETLKKFADFFEVSTDYLLGRTNQKNIPNDYEIQTIAAHREGDGEWTKEELEEIERFKEFVRMKKRGNK